MFHSSRLWHSIANKRVGPLRYTYIVSARDCFSEVRVIRPQCPTHWVFDCQAMLPMSQEALLLQVSQDQTFLAWVSSSVLGLEKAHPRWIHQTNRCQKQGVAFAWPKDGRQVRHCSHWAWQQPLSQSEPRPGRSTVQSLGVRILTLNQLKVCFWNLASHRRICAGISGAGFSDTGAVVWCSVETSCFNFCVALCHYSGKAKILQED